MYSCTSLVELGHLFRSATTIVFAHIPLHACSRRVLGVFSLVPRQLGRNVHPYTVKNEVCTARHFVPIHTPKAILVCVLGQYGVQCTLHFLQCNGLGTRLECIVWMILIIVDTASSWHLLP